MGNDVNKARDTRGTGNLIHTAELSRLSPLRLSPLPNRLSSLVLAALALTVLYMQIRPGLAWPPHGILQGCLLTGLLALSVYAGVYQSRVCLPKRVVAAGAAIAAFAAWTWGRTLFSQMHSEEAAFMSGSLVLGAGAFWIGALLAAANRKRALAVAVGLFTTVAVLHALYALIQYHLIFPIEYHQRLNATNTGDMTAAGVLHQLAIRRVGSSFGNPNVFAGFLAMFIPMLGAVGWTFSTRRKATWFETAGLVAIPLAAVIYALHRTDSTGGRMVAAVGMAGTVLVCLVTAYRGQHERRSAAVTLAVVFGLALASLALPLGPVSLKEVDDNGETTAPRSQKTLLQRVYYLKSARAMFSERPLVGHGAAAFAELYPQYRVKGSGEARYAHNFVAQTAVESGLIGLGLLGIFAALCVWIFVNGLLRGSPGAAWLTVAAAAMLFVADSLGEYTFYVREVLIIAMLLTGLAVGSTSSEPSKKRLPTVIMSFVILALLAGLLWPATVRPLRIREALRVGRGNLNQALYAPGLTPKERQWMLGEARRQSDVVVHLDNKNAEAWSLRAAIDESSRRPDLAIANIREAIKRSPRSAALRAQLARLLWQTRQANEALETIKAAVDLHPLDSRHRMQYARYLNALGRNSEALEQAQRALDNAILPEDILAAEIILDAIKGSNK